MVLIHYKRNKTDQFIISMPASSQINLVREELVSINNLRIKLDKLIQSMKGLISHGPLKPEALRGLTQPETIEPAIETLPKDQLPWARPDKPGPNQEIRMDETGYRTGLAPSPSISEKCINQMTPFMDLLSPENANKRKTISKQELLDAIDKVRACLWIVYPGYHSLPPWETAVMILEDQVKFTSQWPDCGWLEAEKCALWWAKKELDVNKVLSSYIGKNEKTKIIVKISQKGKGAPLAEAPIDEETHKKMMAYYYKKQEQQKKLEQNYENDYLNSAWANPNNLKNQMVNGGRGIRWK
jgi:hypothetical protein